MITEKQFVGFWVKYLLMILEISDEAYREHVTRDDYPHLIH